MTHTSHEESIVSLIIDRTIADLLDELQTMISTVDDSRAFLVRRGALQDDPTPGINVLVFANDPFNPNGWEHTSAAMEKGGIGLGNYATEIGGGSLFYRRFTIQIKSFWKPSHTREDAERLSHVVLSRAERLIDRLTRRGAPIGPDTFGEVALDAIPMRSQTLQKGGPGQFISEGYIRFMVLTGREI